MKILEKISNYLNENDIKKNDIYKYEGDTYRVSNVSPTYVMLQYKTGPNSWSDKEIEVHIDNFKDNYKKVMLKEANEEALDREFNFERFVSILSKLQVKAEDGEQGEITIKAYAEPNKYRRIVLERKQFDVLNKSDKIVKLANHNGFYVFGNNEKVVLVEYKDYPQQKYAIKQLTLIGKKDLD